MEEQQLTTSSVIQFAETLEDRSSSFYEELARRFAAENDSFLGFAKDGKKNKTLVVRTYQETITDMLEACYCFEGLGLSQYEVQTTLSKTAPLGQALKTAIELEEKAVAFYLDVAERSQSLLATIPKAFRKVADVRGRRKVQLEALLGGAA